MWLLHVVPCLLHSLTPSVLHDRHFSGSFATFCSCLPSCLQARCSGPHTSCWSCCGPWPRRAGTQLPCPLCCARCSRCWQQVGCGPGSCCKACTSLRVHSAQHGLIASLLQAHLKFCRQLDCGCFAASGTPAAAVPTSSCVQPLSVRTIMLCSFSYLQPCRRALSSPKVHGTHSLLHSTSVSALPFFLQAMLRQASRRGWCFLSHGLSACATSVHPTPTRLWSWLGWCR
mgnify:CR=1 FL=1